MVEEGKPAPEFSLPADSGAVITLSALRGRPVAIYFYPKGDTPPRLHRTGMRHRDAWGEFEKRGAAVLGVSPDGAASHAKFRDKYDLPFTLLADADHAVADEYGVWVEKSFAGKTYMSVERSTFVIDADGIVVKIMRKMKPADDVLAALPE